MKYTESINQLLESLSQKTGGDKLILNEKNAAFTWLSGMLFSFILSEEDEDTPRELFCIVHISPFPDSTNETLHPLLLQLLQDNNAWSNTGGGILGVDDDTGFLCLSLRLDPLQETPEMFIEKIACIYQISLQWQTRLSTQTATAATSLLEEQL